MAETPGGPFSPLPTDTKVPEPKVLSATITAGGVIAALVTLAQLLYDRADLIAFLPDLWEAPVLAIVTAIATYGAAYAARHQFRLRPSEG